MRTCIKILFLLAMPALCLAQQSHIDSLRDRLKTARTDSAYFSILIDLGWSFAETNRDTSLYFQDRAFKVAKKNDRPLEEAAALNGKGYVLMHLFRFPESLQCLQQALALGEDQANETNIWFNIDGHFNPHENRVGVLANTHHLLGHLMGRT
jgi:tetratricopeptide (TPR) repeat protein